MDYRVDTLYSEDYDMFHYLPEINREIKQKRVTKMRQAVQTVGAVIRPVVCTKMSVFDGEEKLYVVDGQSLLEAMKGLKQSIPYILIDVNNSISQLIFIMSTINTTGFKWELVDYVHAWKYEKGEYVTLDTYQRRYSMSYVGVTCCAMNIEDNDESAPIIKAGNFKITNDNVINLLELSIDLLDTEGLGDVSRLPDKFIASFVRYYNSRENYNHQLVKQRIVDNIDIIRASDARSVNSVLRERIFF